MTDTIYSVIDEGLTIDGNLTSSGAFEICGTITGNVKVDEVIVAVGGLISGDISARVATVFGTVEGRQTQGNQNMLILSRVSMS